jgi:ubiquitin carboxyl-terminal hydrolase 7
MAGPVAQQVEEPVQVSVNDRMYLPSPHQSAKPTLHALADEAFMQRHLPDLGQEVEDTQVFTWPLTNWRKLERKMTSPDFVCGGHKWQVP